MREVVAKNYVDFAGKSPEKTQLVMTGTNAEREALNKQIRDKLKAGDMVRDEMIITGKNDRLMSVGAGDRIMFLSNEYTAMNIRNGEIGTISAVQNEAGKYEVKLDSGRSVTVSANDYKDVDYGYATTVHKAQGVTVDRAQIVADRSMVANNSYVAMTRHRDGVEMHFNGEDFAGANDVIQSMHRLSTKDMAHDYIDPRELGQEHSVEAERQQVIERECGRGGRGL